MCKAGVVVGFKDDFDSSASESVPDKEKAWVEITSDGGEISTGQLSVELDGNWDSILLGFNLDPNVFEVVDDTVRCSKWQSSKRLENGDRDLVWLFSYRARFRRRRSNVVSDEDIDAIRHKVSKWRPSTVKKQVSDAVPCTFVVCLADWQLGKSADGGVDATVAYVVKSFNDVITRVADLRKTGRNIEKIMIANMGDPIEGCGDHYASQTFTVELNQRQQLLLALDLWTQAVGRWAVLAEGAEFLSVLCNHGEWMRRGQKSITSDSDNAGAFLAEALQRILADRDDLQHIKWSIPHDEMTITSVLSGVNVAFTHGHTIPSPAKEADWIRGQSIRILREEGREPDLWVTAHRHHLSVADFGAYTRIQCPTLDGGSKWWTDRTGLWSSRGTLTFTVGTHTPLGWADLAVL